MVITTPMESLSTKLLEISTPRMKMHREVTNIFFTYLALREPCLTGSARSLMRRDLVAGLLGMGNESQREYLFNWSEVARDGAMA
jgi:hypothetical protein